MKAGMIEEISGYIALDKDSLLEKGIELLLKERKRGVMLDRLGILSHYKVSSGEELERKIREGEIDDHPAWEDLITLENLDTAQEKINGYLANLSASA
ncbi:MAG: hypothetical protein DDT28_00571 [Dehalococcoidia bacterium]|nr:hypothetical protein [Chloroflexota bacterium]